ncbi:hypothetical protein MTO96_016372 [Rhipicephalus appendiculatus]
MICEASVTLKISAAIIFVALGWAELLRRETSASRKIRGATLLDIAHLVLTLASAIAYSLKPSVYLEQEHYVCVQTVTDLVMCLILRLLCAQYSSGFVFIILVMVFLASTTDFFAEKLRVLQV